MKSKFLTISTTVAGTIILFFGGCNQSTNPAKDDSPVSGSHEDNSGQELAAGSHNGEISEHSMAAANSPDDQNADGQALRAMGYMVGQQVGLQVGYSEEELEYIISGIRLAWETEEKPPDLQEHLNRAKVIVQEKRAVYLKKQRENAVKEAGPNIIAGENFLEELSSDPEVKKTESGLHYKILEKGDGVVPKETDWIKVNYRGTLIDGAEFDSSYKRNVPGEFALNRVVKGWTEGLQLIGEGGKIMLYVPSDLAYGNSPRPGGLIKPGDLLIFEIEILKVTGERKPPKGFPANIPPPPTGPPPGFPPTRRPPDIPRNLPSPPPTSLPSVVPPSPPGSEGAGS